MIKSVRSAGLRNCQPPSIAVISCTRAFTVCDDMMTSRRMAQKRDFDSGLPWSKEEHAAMSPSPQLGSPRLPRPPNTIPVDPSDDSGSSGTQTTDSSNPRPVKSNLALCARPVIHPVVLPQSRAGVTTPFELYYLVFTPGPNYTPIRQLSGFAHWPPGSLSYCSCRY